MNGQVCTHFKVSSGMLVHLMQQHVVQALTEIEVALGEGDGGRRGAGAAGHGGAAVRLPGRPGTAGRLLRLCLARLRCASFPRQLSPLYPRSPLAQGCTPADPGSTKEFSGIKAPAKKMDLTLSAHPPMETWLARAATLQCSCGQHISAHRSLFAVRCRRIVRAFKNDMWAERDSHQISLDEIWSRGGGGQ